MSQNDLGGQYGIIYICILITVNSRTLEIVNLFWNVLLLLIRFTYSDVIVFLITKKIFRRMVSNAVNRNKKHGMNN